MDLAFEAEGVRAAREGDLEALRAWLRSGAPADAHDAAGWTPLIAAASRGQAAAVTLLLEHRADPAVPHRASGALAIHLAGHSGSVPTAEALLSRRPDHLDAVWDLNGHTVLLQAVFYGHLELAAALLRRGADTSITTARGLGPMELAAQFQNRAMMELILPFDRPAAAKVAYYQRYLARVAPTIPPGEVEAQDRADRLVHAIEAGLRDAAKDPARVEGCLAEVRALLEAGADPNRLGGPLQQPPLVVTVTGNDGLPASPDVARLRLALAELLLDRGADPVRREKHPMGATTIIRACVFNHLRILEACARHLIPQALADALNEIPVVNGLTALHDTVLRGTMAGPDRIDGYVAQTRWAVSHGARSDLEDFAGRTQRAIAEGARDPETRRRLLEALGG